MSIPHDASKHGRPSVVRPEVLAAHGLESGAYAQIPPPRAAIMLYHRGLAQRVLDGRETTKIPGFFGDTWLLHETSGEVAIVADFGIGAPAAAVVLEDLIALGCTTVISVGTCGGMDPALQVGDMIVCSGAVRDEGTSHHYAADDGSLARPDLDLSQRLEATVRARGIDPRVASTWTTDAPYRETAEEVLAHVAAGVPVVEMEAAALFTVAAIRGASVASLLVVSDLLDTLDGSWSPSFHGDDVSAGLATAVDIALATIR